MNLLKALWVTEPARLIAALAALAVFVAAKAGVVVSEQDVGAALLIILPILLGGEAARTKVSPAPPPVDEDSDALLARQLGGS